MSVDDVFEQPLPAERQYHIAAHGETSHANQQPTSVNTAHIKGMHDVLQVVKDIQATLKTELSDIRTKVDFLYAKYSLAEDKNSEDLHNTNIHQKSQHESPPNPSPNSPSPPPLRPPIRPTKQNPVVEVSSHHTQTLPQPQQNIPKSTPSSMNAPDSYMEEQRIDDLYHVPAVLTVPSLVDEYIVFTCPVGEEYTLRKSVSKLRESYMSDLRKCQKMQSLDIVLADDIAVAFPTSFSFTDYSISYAEASIQPNGYDCGLFVCMFMDDNCPTPVQMKSFQSECQRLFWARFLALFPGNTNLLTLKKNSQQHYQNLVANKEVVPRPNIKPPPLKKLKGKAADLMESSL
ncbi:hypothetical protein Q3G72_009425 [Acer saccharum]|nr:hypothetical protein Q3G72_009425 [Acer saccharum]